jgi:hypothetical protein
MIVVWDTANAMPNNYGEQEEEADELNDNPRGCDGKTASDPPPRA